MFYTELQLGKILSKMYEDAPYGEAVTMIHLFGILYGQVIKDNNYSIAKIIKNSKINESYKTEVNKGINLSKYVELKPEQSSFIDNLLDNLR